MKLKTFYVLSCLAMLGQLAATAQPVVSNVRAAQRAGTQLVDIYYDLASASNALMVSVSVSTNGGAGYTVPASSFTGAVGAGIAPGTNRKITWNAGQDWPTNFSAGVRFRITADDAVPGGMALIPAGSFTMGDNLDGSSYAVPLHTVYVSAFYMDKYDVTKAQWDSVYQWATNRPVEVRYSFDNAGLGKASTHPVQTINWYDCVKWCNARSEQEGKVPAYYTTSAQTTIYRTGQVNVDNSWVNWSSGYRLPTEAEWEKAARGGASGQRFPWGNTITESQANYSALPSVYAYDVNSYTGWNTNYANGASPYTSPVGSFAPNGYGLYDMAGNVWQWCWDWWDGSWYSNAGATQNDTRGPVSGSLRVLRGGSWGHNAFNCRSANRSNHYNPANSYDNIGFRSVLPPGQ